MVSGDESVEERRAEPSQSGPEGRLLRILYWIPSGMETH